MTHLSTHQLAELAGITKRQIQKILESEVLNIGASRTPGGHWIIPDSPAVRRWAKGHHRWRRGGLPKANINPPSPKGIQFVSIESVAFQFKYWQRKMSPRFKQWDADCLDRAIGLLEPQAQVHAELVARRDALERGK